MLDSVTVEQIRLLLEADKLSQREIAEQMGVSRGTVNAIANGRRAMVHAARTADDESLAFDGPLVRCHGCGGRVYAPCRLCHIRRLKAGEKSQRRGESATFPKPR